MNRKSPAGSVLAAVGYLSLVPLGASALMLREYWEDWSGADPTPQPMSLAELLTNGPGDNRHVTVSRFVAGNGGVVSVRRDNVSFVMLTPQDPLPPGVTPVLVFEVPFRDPGPVESLIREPAITGMYSTGIVSSSREGRQMLEQRYRGLDLRTCPSLEHCLLHGKWYFYCAVVMGCLSGAVFLTCVLGIVWLVCRAKLKERNAPSD